MRIYLSGMTGVKHAQPWPIVAAWNIFECDTSPREVSMKRLLAICTLIFACSARMLSAQGDRGTGIRTSMVGTYVEPHQLLIYPFAAYSWDHNFEYQPTLFGIAREQDFRGHYKTTEAAVFLAYGVTDWLALELEGSQITATFEKSPADTFGTPARVREMGVADIAGQLRLRLGHERGGRPEFFASVEVLPRMHPGRVLIGDTQWDVKGEIGAVRAYRWGTMTFRTTIEYNHGDTHWDLGETSLEYLRQVSPAWRVLLGIEGGEGGAPDDWVFVSAGAWRIARGLDLKFVNGVGLFSKSTDWESQIGLQLTLSQ